MVELLANSGDPDQMLHSVKPDLGLYCLPATRLGVFNLQWNDKTFIICLFTCRKLNAELEAKTANLVKEAEDVLVITLKHNSR